MISRSATLFSIIALLGTLLPSFASAVDAPNHSLDFGYYYAYSKYGNFSDVDCYTNLYYVGRADFVSDLADDQFLTALGSWLAGASARSKKVILDLGYTKSPALANRIIDAAAPYWNSIAYLEIAGEPGWSK